MDFDLFKPQGLLGALVRERFRAEYMKPVRRERKSFAEQEAKRQRAKQTRKAKSTSRKRNKGNQGS